MKHQRLVRHSTRYKGPMGDSRPPSEIFAKMEARAKEGAVIRERLIAALDIALNSRQLATYESRLDMINDTYVKWRASKSPSFRDKLEQAGIKIDL